MRLRRCTRRKNRPRGTHIEQHGKSYIIGASKAISGVGVASDEPTFSQTEFAEPADQFSSNRMIIRLTSDLGTDVARMIRAETEATPPWSVLPLLSGNRDNQV